MLAALWGASFLFTRMAAPAFGAFALAEVRVAVAALVLLPLLALRGGLTELRRQPARFTLLGAVNTAIPFTLFAWAALSITAGTRIDPECNSAALRCAHCLGLAARPADPAAMARHGHRLRRRVVAGDVESQFLRGRHRLGDPCRPGRDVVLRPVCERGQAVLQRRASARRGGRQPDRGGTPAAPIRGPGVAGEFAGTARLGRGDCARRALHRNRLHPVLPAHRPRRACHRDDRDVPDSGVCDAVGRPFPWRTGHRHDDCGLRRHPRRYFAGDRAAAVIHARRASST